MVTKIGNQKTMYSISETLRGFAGIAHDVTPADCGLDFEGISSPQSPAITARNTGLVTVSLADSTDDCTGICMGNDAKLKGARKCQRHPPRPQQDDRISTRNVHQPELHLWESQHNSAKYTRYLKLLKGKPVTLTDLGIFSQFVGKLAALKTL